MSLRQGGLVVHCYLARVLAFLCLDAKRTWRAAGGHGAACDSTAGEVYMKSSPGKVKLGRCKKACENTAGCQSITYFNNGWCSHYSTPCTKTTWSNKAVALRLSLESVTTATTITAIGQCG